MPITRMTALVGIRACGASTKARISKEIFASSKVNVIDMSAILVWGKAQPSLQAQLAENQQVQEKGKYVDDATTNEALKLFVQEINRTKPEVEHLFIAGYPRTIAQREFVERLIEEVRFIHIVATADDSKWGVHNRPDVRKDHTEEALAENHQAYHTHTVPAMNMRPELVTVVDRGLKLMDQMELILDGCAAEDRHKVKALRRLASDSDVHELIRKVENNEIRSAKDVRIPIRAAKLVPARPPSHASPYHPREHESSMRLSMR